ncbi:hypothetical protein RUM44_012681 [Polyplax serrata]|uniref:Probable ATP-dependent RNA helicase DDX52 n=1 Tax=Polyplax serrata TaxID=468196 RepID=A0ABR1BFW0_POLSC
MIKSKSSTLNIKQEPADTANSPIICDGFIEDDDVTIKNESPASQIHEHQPLELLKGLPAEDSIQDKNEKRKKKKENTSTNFVTFQRQQEQQLSEIRNKLRISVIGTNTPWPLESFNELVTRFNVNPVIVNNLEEAGFKTPTPIQAQAIPTMLEGRQLLGCAPTGSGKTAAFLIPVLHHLKGPLKKGYRSVVVCPTRELARQTYRECTRLSEGTGLRTNIVNKVSLDKDKFNLKSSKKFDILITTPNRLVYLLKQEPPKVDLKNVEWLIVDESDKLFEAGIRGFRDQLAVIYNACSSSTIKRAMFSATQTPHLTKWCRKNLKNLVLVNIGVRNSAVETVKQELLFVGNEAGKLVAFRNLINRGLTPPVLVFVQSKERAQELFNELVYDGINVDVIHSDRTQKQRDNVIRSFREGKVWVLICTELMGRGIDFKGVNLVVNYDFPPSSISYIHRIGRTGRAGRQGRAVTYFTQDDTTNLRSIARLLKNAGCEVPEYMLTMKKSNKSDRKKLEKKAPHRESISTTPIYEKELKRKRKRNKAKQKGEKKMKMGAAASKDSQCGAQSEK